MLLYITNQTKMLLGRGRKIKDLRRLKNHGSGRGELRISIKHLLSYFTGVGYCHFRICMQPIKICILYFPANHYGLLQFLELLVTLLCFYFNFCFQCTNPVIFSTLNFLHRCYHTFNTILSPIKCHPADELHTTVDSVVFKKP
jgi:hypothetical protein